MVYRAQPIKVLSWVHSRDAGSLYWSGMNLFVCYEVVVTHSGSLPTILCPQVAGCNPVAIVVPFVLLLASLIIFIAGVTVVIFIAGITILKCRLVQLISA